MYQLNSFCQGWELRAQRDCQRLKKGGHFQARGVGDPEGIVDGERGGRVSQ